MDIGYHYLSEPNAFNDLDTKNYKVGVNFNFPIFLRKERASLKLAQFKISESQFALDLEKVQLKNKINAQQTEILSLEKQRKIADELVNDYSTMLNSEERLFSFGESSIFLLNSRENNLVNAQLYKIVLENRYLISNVELFKVMVNPD